jgi:hypothetical protein
MSKHKTCHGCDGKGWVLIVHSERTQPWRDEITRKPVDGFAMTTREYESAKCLICHGSGIVISIDKLADDS